MNINSIKCQISKTNTNIKPFQSCLLRYGVEHSAKQSFIACIADVFVEFINQRFNMTDAPVPDIVEMKEIIKSTSDWQRDLVGPLTH